MWSYFHMFHHTENIPNPSPATNRTNIKMLMENKFVMARYSLIKTIQQFSIQLAALLTFIRIQWIEVVGNLCAVYGMNGGEEHGRV